MAIFWSIVLVVGILVLAYWIRKAVKGTPFENETSSCTPRIKKLKQLEDTEEKKK